VVEACRYSDVAPAGGDDVDVVDLILAIRALRIGAVYILVPAFIASASIAGYSGMDSGGCTVPDAHNSASQAGGRENRS
jgi:hypothetical protein